MSDFLKNLKQSLDTGKPNEAIVAGFDEILTKADKIGSDPGRLKEIEEKAELAQASRKPLTAEEIKELEFVALKQQQKIDEFEFQTTLAASLINIDLTIEKLESKIVEFKIVSAQLRDESISASEKKLIVKNVLKEINSTENTVEQKDKFTIGDDDVIYGEDGSIYDKITE